MSSYARRGFDVAMLVLAGVAVLAVAIDMTGVVRQVLVLAAAMLVPGSALVRFLHPSDIASFLGLAVVVSLAIGTVTSMILVWLDWWHPFELGIAVTVISCGVLAWDIRAISRSTQEATV